MILARYKLLRSDPGVPASLEERLFAQTDVSYNITSITNTFGQVFERYVYTPFVAFAAVDGSWTSLQGGVTQLGWRNFDQGGRYDATMGLYTYGERDYSPSLGRVGWVIVSADDYSCAIDDRRNAEDIRCAYNILDGAQTATVVPTPTALVGGLPIGARWMIRRRATRGRAIPGPAMVPQRNTRLRTRSVVLRGDTAG